MPDKYVVMNDGLYDYLKRVTVDEHPTAARLRERTEQMPNAGMQVSPDQARFMALMMKLTGARRVLEIGTFTGYSALHFALALPADGSVVCCDVSEEYTSIGGPFWEEAGVVEMIDLRIAPALQTLDGLIAQGAAGSFDAAFIDADKTGYDAYYERCLTLLRGGGLIMIDNVLWDGHVTNMEKDDENTRAIRAINAKVFADDRVDASLATIGDGITLARKRGG